MISFEAAFAKVMEQTRDFGLTEVPLELGVGRVLRESWYADRDMPPYDRITMDGIAIHFDSVDSGQKLPIAGIVAAGDPMTSLHNPRHCLEVMTGAIMPAGADTVIRYEDISIADGFAIINCNFKKSQNIHFKGEDRKKGELLLSPGVKLAAPEIGVGASIGKSHINVSAFPKIALVSTGDELVDIHIKPLPHQIRKSNVYRIAATLSSIGMECAILHLQDDLETTKNELRQLLISFDVIIVSGGVSKGKFDHIPGALNELGVQKLFHKVAQRPGKPFWFGIDNNGKTVFALPGNPVSSFMCTHVYVIPWLMKSMGTYIGSAMAELQETVRFAKDLTYFLECKIEQSEGGLFFAHPKKGRGSGDLANLMRGDAFIQLPRGQVEYRKGEVYPIYFYR